MVDVQTLFLTSIISRSAFLTVFVVTVLNQPGERYLRHWLAALACSGLGLLMFLAPVEGPLSNFFNTLRQVLVLSSLTFSWSGMRLFYGRALRARRLWMLTLLPALLHTLLMTWDVPERYALPPLFLAASFICTLIIREILFSIEKELIIQYVIAAAFVLYFLGLFPPVILLPLGLMPEDIATSSTTVMLLDQVGCVMVYFGYIALVGENTNLKLKRLSETDPLTGLSNRRGAQQALQKRGARSAPNAPASVVLCDLDHFKAINDALGHETGDAVLRIFAERLRRLIRSDDIAVRWGGEEFLILLPDAGISEAEQLAERLRRAVADEPFAIDEHRLEITASLGVAENYPDDRDTEAAIRRADSALYRAKNSGRDRVCRHMA